MVYDAGAGVFVRYLGFKVIAAQVLGKLVQVTSEGGKVEIYDALTGVLQRTLSFRLDHLALLEKSRRSPESKALVRML